jgi:hypothetical protein
MPTIHSTPSTFTITIPSGQNTGTQNCTFAIPAGFWLSASWEVAGTVTPALTFIEALTTDGTDVLGSNLSGSYDVTAPVGSGNITAINAAAGTNLAVEMVVGGTGPVTDDVTLFTLTLNGGSGSSSGSSRSSGSSGSSGSGGSQTSGSSGSGGSSGRSSGSSGSSGSGPNSGSSGSAGGGVGNGNGCCNASLPLSNQPLLALTAMDQGSSPGSNLGNHPQVTGNNFQGPSVGRYPTYGDLLPNVVGMLGDACCPCNSAPYGPSCGPPNSCGSGSGT